MKLVFQFNVQVKFTIDPRVKASEIHGFMDTVRESVGRAVDEEARKLGIDTSGDADCMVTQPINIELWD